MNLELIKEKLLFQMTGKEFLFLQEQRNNPTTSQNEEPLFINKKYVYGILGIAKIFNCSKSTANRIKKEGIIEGAIIQNGRKIIVDVELAMSLLEKHKLKKR